MLITVTVVENPHNTLIILLNRNLKNKTTKLFAFHLINEYEKKTNNIISMMKFLFY